jgi:type I restriction enzyme, S subunit
MSEWKEYKLTEITTKIGSGSTPKGGKDAYFESGITLIRSMNVYDFAFEYKDLAFIDEDQAKKLSGVTVQENDILLNITGASVGRCTIVPLHLLPARVNQHVSIIRTQKERVNSKFLLYCINSSSYKSMLMTISGSGATREALTKVDIENFKVLLPNISEQYQIATILSTYDELIENNTRRIAILEQTAEQIYKEWFVRMRFPGYEKTEFEKGVPKRWGVKKLNKLVSTQYGYTASADHDIDGPKFLRITDIASSLIDWENVPRCPISENEIQKYKLNYGDIVVARTGATAGYAKRIHKLHPDSVFASYLVRMILKNIRLNNYIGIIVQSNTYKDFVMSIAGGAAQPQANANVLTEISVFVPEMQIIEKFNKIIEPLFDQMELLINQNQNLKQTRDLLLPRLISGKLKVKAAEKEMKKM